jgi:16S rRNA (uracil1498-N3)-methyltransferase
MKHRFFVPPESIGRIGVLFPPETAQQIRRVLRLRPGAEVVVLDGLGWEYWVNLETVSNEKVWGRLQNRQPASGEPALQVTLYLSLTQREKFEWALQKCTEVGVSIFVPVISNRTLSRDKDKALQKIDRWTRILREAAEQSRRGLVPHITEPLNLKDAFQQIERSKLPAALLWEDEKERSLYNWLVTQAREASPTRETALALFIGPEGGYTDQESEQAKQAGVQSVSLGRRILRMETAAVVATALAMNAFGDLNT